MSNKFTNHLDLALKEIRNALLHLLGADPGAPNEGQYWYNTGSKRFRYRDDTATRDVAHLNDIASTRLDQLAAPTADVNFNSRKITNLSDGSSAQDAVTYGQLQSVLNGRAWKDAVRAATTSNITLSGLQTIDSISVAAGDRVLVKDQTTGSENGIYIVASGAWIRSNDADTSAKMVANTTVKVQEGTANGDKEFTLTTNAPITLGTTSLTFALTGQGTTYSQGNGVSISGNIIAVDAAVVARKYSADYGDGTATSFTITHNLGTKDVVVSVRKKSTDELWAPDAAAPTINTITILHAVAPTAAEFRVTVIA